MSNDHSETSIKKRVGEFLILALYLAIDAYEIWPHSHIVALALVPVGVVALLLLDGGVSTKRTCQTGAITILACVGIYFSAPPILPEETDTHGWFEPAGDPFPSDNACTKGGAVQQLPNGMLFSLGKDGMWFQKKPGGARPLLTVGACTLMSGEFENDQFLFSADIYDSERELVARIERNEFHLVPAKYAYPDRPDRSTLKIYDKGGKLLLSVHRRNKDAMDVTGVFTCSDGKEAKVEKDGKLTMTGPNGSRSWDRDCIINGGGFVVTDGGFGIGPTPCWACDGPTCPLVCARERARQEKTRR
jgi:hypothetical protein